MRAFLSCGRFAKFLWTRKKSKNYITFKKKITFSDTGIVINYPNQVEIFYDKGNPAKAYADVELTPNIQKQTGCHISIVVPIVAIILIYNLLKLI